MTQPKRLYTIIAFTENRIGLLNRITIIFTRRHINIESLTTSECEVDGVHRFTITVRTTEERAVKVVKQIEKLIEVIKASLHTEEDTMYQELALFKIDAHKIAADGSFTAFLSTLKKYNAEIQSSEKDYIIVQKIGRRVEIFMLLDALKEYHVLEFAKSGRVAMTRSAMDLDGYLHEVEQRSLIPDTLSTN
ncbi:MAG: acetolactate synthase small subunit [Candidatus Kapaibacterium sp.]|nr:MAG: acetolactate synthase small subunit [Candidatus Kapabacteria bacterium]